MIAFSHIAWSPAYLYIDGSDFEQRTREIFSLVLVTVFSPVHPVAPRGTFVARLTFVAQSSWAGGPRASDPDLELSMGP
jgi:hypothetical protein